MPTYVKTHDLEQHWDNWNKTQNPQEWAELSLLILKICEGISKKFHPKSEEEYEELVNEAFIETMEKIKQQKLRYIPGKAPVFNLLTTTIFNILYSKMNRKNRQKIQNEKYTKWYIQKHAPELLKNDLYRPDSS